LRCCKGQLCLANCPTLQERFRGVNIFHIHGTKDPRLSGDQGVFRSVAKMKGVETRLVCSACAERASARGETGGGRITGSKTLDCERNAFRLIRSGFCRNAFFPLDVLGPEQLQDVGRAVAASVKFPIALRVLLTKHRCARGTTRRGGGDGRERGGDKLPDRRRASD
jgi:hypothetical protein